MTKKIICCLTVVAMTMSIAACAGNKTETPNTIETVNPVASETPISTDLMLQEAESYYPVTITNYNYAKEPIEMTFYEAPTKVLAVYQNSIETLLALGLEDKIVAASGLDHDVKPEFANAFAEVHYLTEFAPDRETVIMMEPDFILSWYSLFGERSLGEVDYWHQNDVNTYMMLNSGAAAERALENEYEDILNIGKIFNVTDKAEVIVDEIKLALEEAVQFSQGLAHKPRVLVIEFLNDDIRVYGENTLAGDMVKKIGAELVTVEGQSISAEDLIALNPDVIFSVYFGDASDVTVAEQSLTKIKNEPKYVSLEAVIQDKVFAISLGETYCSGIRTVDGIKRLIDGIYSGDIVNYSLLILYRLNSY